jgi:hypothetical protein
VGGEPEPVRGLPRPRDAAGSRVFPLLKENAATAGTVAAFLSAKSAVPNLRVQRRRGSLTQYLATTAEDGQANL